MIDAPSSDRLKAYFDRIGIGGASGCTPDGLAALVAAHRRAIAFENLDVRLGRPIRIDGDSVFDKLVTRRRGGYCFEQNRLLGDMLTMIGFDPHPLLARVLLGMPEGAMPPRTHVLLHLTFDGTPWIADGGFGGADLPPLPLADGARALSGDGATYRLTRIGTQDWLLERAARPDEWQAQYRFDLTPVVQADLEQGNHWTSTRPGERFTSLHIASIVLPDGFIALTEWTLTTYRAGTSETREIADATTYGAALRDLFGLAISDAEVAALPLFSS